MDLLFSEGKKTYLTSCDHVGIFCQQIDQFAFTLIAPLSTKDHLDFVANLSIARHFVQFHWIYSLENVLEWQQRERMFLLLLPRTSNRSRSWSARVS